MTSINLWLISSLIDLSYTLGIITIIAVVVVGIFEAVYFLVNLDGQFPPSEECRKKNKKFLMWFIPIVAFVIVLVNFTPSKKELAAIYIIPRVVNSERVQTISDKALNVLIKYLEENETKTEESK